MAPQPEHSSQPSAQSQLPLPERGVKWILGAALVLGLLRFVRLGHWSLWLDEIFTWGDAHGHESGSLNQLGYQLVRWTVEALGGDPSEFALRLTPAVIGYLSIPLTYWAFRPLGGPRRAAWAALLLAVSPWAMQWSQTARFYTMVQATGILGAGLAIRGLLAGRWLVILLGVATIGLGVLFHLQGAAIAGAVGFAAALFPPGDRPGSHRAARLAFLTFAVPGIFAVPRVVQEWQKYSEFKGASDPLAGVLHFALSTGAYVTPTVAAAALVSIVLSVVARDRRGLFVAAVPLVGGGALALLATQATVSAQYAFGLLPWIALLAVWSTGQVGTVSGKGSALQAGTQRSSGTAWMRDALPFVVALTLFGQTGLYLSTQQGQRPRWREAIEFVAERREPGDVIVASPASVVEFYLTGGDEVDVRRHDSVVMLDVYRARSYAPYAEAGRKIWLVLRTDYRLSLAQKDQVALTRFLTERCRHAAHFPVRVEGRDLDVDVWKFEE